METAWICVKTSPWTLAIKEWAVATWQCTVSHFLFSPRNFLPKQHDCHPPPTRLTLPGHLGLLSLSLIEDTAISVEVTEAEVQGSDSHFSWGDRGWSARQCWTLLQNTTSRMCLQKDRCVGNGAYAQKGTTLRVMLTSRPKVSFWPDCSTSPGSYGYK
jgi:hypothetical protein